MQHHRVGLGWTASADAVRRRQHPPTLDERGTADVVAKQQERADPRILELRVGLFASDDELPGRAVRGRDEKESADEQHAGCRGWCEHPKECERETGCARGVSPALVTSLCRLLTSMPHTHTHSMWPMADDVARGGIGSHVWPMADGL
eukprot:4066681-Prymnesium_polylepis.1